MQKNSFTLKPSRLILLMLFFMAMVSCVAFFSLSAQWWVQGLIICVLCGYFAYLYQRYYLLNSDAISGLEKLAGNQWLLSLSSGDQVKAQLEGDSTLTSLFSMLCFADVKSAKKYSCLVCYDSLEVNQYAALHFAIKWS